MLMNRLIHILVSLPKVGYIGPYSAARSARRSSVVIQWIIYIGSRERSVLTASVVVPV